MMTTVYEKTKKLHKSSDDPLEEKLQSFELDATENGLNEITKDDKSEQKIALSTSKAVPGASKDSVKVYFTPSTTTDMSNSLHGFQLIRMGCFLPSFIVRE